MRASGPTGGGLPAPEPVVLGVQPGLRLGGTVLLVPLAAGITLALLAAVGSGDPGAPMGGTGWSASVAAGWVVSVLVLVGSVLALWALWSYRVALDERQVSWRLLWLARCTPFEDVARVEALGSRPRSIAGDAPGALVLRGPYGEVVATFRPSETRWPAVLAMLLTWVRRRPDLVGDERTEALFAAASDG